MTADTVSSIYKAFGEGDIATILGHLDDQVAWDADWADLSAHRAGVAHLAPRRGRDEVSGFFAGFPPALPCPTAAAKGNARTMAT